MCIATCHRLAMPLLALVAATLAIACASDHAPGRTPGFYAEVAVEVEPLPGVPLARFGSGGGRTVIRWWYAPDPARWRWEVEAVGTVVDDGVVLTIADGDDTWEYDDRTNVYRRGVFAGFPDGVALSPVFSAPVGPTHASTVGELAAQWRERGDEPEVTLAGEATLLGRRTEIVEVRASSGGVARAFVDPERMFIISWTAEAAAGGQSYHAEVTALDYGTEVDAARFAFEPPPGASEAEVQADGSCSGSSSGYTGGGSFPAEPGFLAPAYAPPGYRLAGMGGESSTSGCKQVAVWALLEGADGGAILLRQRLRPGGMPALDGSWRALDSSLDDAHSRSSGDGVVGLLWRAGDIVALLQAEAVSLGELIQIAKSADLVPVRSR